MEKLFIIFAVFSMWSVNAATEFPYNRVQHRHEISTLSAADIRGYLSGKEMGYAKAAELNHYPAPRHVLELAEQLHLTARQKQQSKAILKRMQARAIILGRQIVMHERKLDGLFANDSINEDNLSKNLNEIAKLQGELRYVHLLAHLEQQRLLTRHQLMLYNRLRNYGTGLQNNHPTSQSG